MTCMNHHYTDVKESYLFADIRKRIDTWLKKNPGGKVLRLGIGDVTQPLMPSVIQALHEAVEDQTHAETFHGYMPECGDPGLRQAIAIMDGRKIIYPEIDADHGFMPVPPAEDIQALIYLCSPDNPTGAACTRQCLEQWIEYAGRTGSVILFDAAYESFVQEKNIPRSIYEIEGAKGCAIEISSLSKTAGFTGTRCGYTVIPLSLEREGLSLNKMWVRNRTTKTNGISYILQKGALAVFSEQGQREAAELREVYRRNARNFMQALDEAGLSYTGGKNSPYIWMKCPDDHGSWETFDILLEKGQIVATPGAGFGESGEGWIRFSMFADEEDIREAGRRIIFLRNEKYF